MGKSGIRGAVLLAVGMAALGSDVRLNMVVRGAGELVGDGKGTYVTGVDDVAVWLEPSRWPQMSFDVCMNGRFPNARLQCGRWHTISPLRWRGEAARRWAFSRVLLGNEVALSKPLTASVSTFTDMAVGSSLSPESAEVRFCNSDCTEYYSLIFGAGSLFYRDLTAINGARATKPTVTRVSESKWTITFPAKSVGRLWRRSGELTDLGLFHYEGRLEVERQ